MFDTPTFFLSIHAFLLGVAVMSISRKHAFAMSNEFDNEKIVKRIKQYTYFFNISLIVGAMSMVVVLLYLFSYSLAPLDSATNVHVFFVCASIFEILVLSITLMLCFGWGGFTQLSTMIGSN